MKNYDSGQWEWECSACTFINSHINHQSACQLCLIERRRPWNDSSALSVAIEKRERMHSDDVVIESTSNHSLSNNYNLEPSEPWRTELDAEISKCNDDASVEQGDINHKHVINGRWDAFASLQANYESSSDEDEDDDRSCDGVSIECSDGDFVDKGGINGECDRKSDYHDSLCHNDDGFNSKMTSLKTKKNPVECINLVDSDDENDKLDLLGKENEKNMLQTSQLKKRPTKRDIESDSDCSLSEEESHRPIPSPSVRGLPSWQPPRRRSSAPIQTSNYGNIKSSDQFPCMSTRNDVIGNSSSPCLVSNNVPRLSKVSREEGRRQPSKKSSTSTETSSVASSSSRKKTHGTSKAATSKGRAKAPVRRRKRGGGGGGGKYKKRSSYKRSSAKRGGARRGAEMSNMNGNNAWSERERGIRQPYRRGGCGGGGESSTGPYMAIAKQEPMLRNVGGASIQF